MQWRAVGRRPLLQHDIVDDHAAADPAEQRRAEHDDEREAVHQREHEAAAPDDDGDAEQQAEDHETEIVLGGARDADDVIDAHHGVGDDDGLHGAEEMRAGVDVVAAAVVLRHQQLDADVEQ